MQTGGVQETVLRSRIPERGAETSKVVQKPLNHRGKPGGGRSQLLSPQSVVNRQERIYGQCVHSTLSCGFLLLVGGVLLLTIPGCRRVPQVLGDEAVFNEVDALYTAVTSKRRDLLSNCRERLSKLHQEQRLSQPGFNELCAVIKLAESDKWSDAAERLYAFMRAQRKQIGRASCRERV